MTYDVVAIGELLIDFTDVGSSEETDPVFQAQAGGAPANVCAMLAKLGKRSSLIAKVGPDFFAPYLIAQVERAGIDTTAITKDPRIHTTLAFVKNTADGERDFAFFRQPGADTQLSEADIDEQLIKEARILHFGSLSLTQQPARQATVRAIQLAQANNCLISFDPNLRPPLWNDLMVAREQMAWGCCHAHILKLSEEELSFLTGESVIPSAVHLLLETASDLKLIFVTRGAAGSEAYYKGKRYAQPAFLSAETIDTTGAGDAFFGACLAKLLDLDIDSLGEREIRDILTFANAAASLVTRKKGALMQMPSAQSIKSLIASEMTQA